MGTGIHWGLFKIEPTTFEGEYRHAEISRDEAIKFCGKWPQAIAKINELDPPFTPHTDQEQLEILKLRLDGAEFSRTEKGTGLVSMHEGPFDFVNYRYEWAANLESEVQRFVRLADKAYGERMGGNPAYVTISICDIQKLQRALKCHQRNTEQPVVKEYQK
jgi:hypothetical protein